MIMSNKQRNTERSLNRIIYKSYLSSALVPIFVIELVLLLLYFGITHLMTQKSQELLSDEARNTLVEISKRETTQIALQLEEVTRLSRMMRSDHEHFFTSGACVLPNGMPQFKRHANGVYYKEIDNGGSSVYYAATTKLGEEEYRKARCSEMLDPLMRSIVETNPIVTQAYINTYDDFNRLYPFMDDAPTQYGPNLHMQDYNFFYLADPAHNPQKTNIWTGAYLDPAGQGWMISNIVPIYNGAVFEGVSGLDVTIDSLVNNILSLEIPWNGSAFLVDEQGMILAMPEKVEQIFHLKELKSHVYKESIKQTIEKPEAYNLLKTPNKEIQEQMSIVFQKENSIETLNINNKRYILTHFTISQTKWKLLILLDESVVLQPIQKLKKQIDGIGYIVIGLMVFFYFIFFLYLLKKSRKVAFQISEPIKEITELTTGLGSRPGYQLEGSVGISEVDQLIGNFNDLSMQLDARTQDYIQSQLREKMKEKDAEIAYRAGLFESASSYLHNIGNALTMLDAKIRMLRKTVNALKKSELGFNKIIAMLDEGQDKFTNKTQIQTFVEEFSHAMTKDVIEEIEEIAQDIVKIKDHAVISISHQQEIFNANSEAKRNYVQHFDVKKLLESLIEDYRLSFIKQGIKINFTSEGDLELATMKFQFQSGISNVIKNAMESIEQCGREHDGEITIVAYRKDERIVIEISDNGIGIESENASSIFSSGFTTKQNGHGLGLHAFNNYLNANNGIIKIRSDGFMKGATVYIEIGETYV